MNQNQVSGGGGPGTNLGPGLPVCGGPDGERRGAEYGESSLLQMDRKTQIPTGLAAAARGVAARGVAVMAAARCCRGRGNVLLRKIYKHSEILCPTVIYILKLLKKFKTSNII